MKRNFKNITYRLVIIALTTLFLTACVINNIPVKSEITNADEIADQIASFDLPQGYKPEFSTTMLGYSFVSYRNGEEMSHLYLVQSENKADEEKLTDMLEKLSPESFDRQDRTEILETKTISIRGEDATLIISDAINGEGNSYRQAIVVFQGKNGPALLVFSESIESWDQQTVEKLISSIE